MKTICIIAIPRTGTNHLCKVLQSIPSAHVLREIFNPAGVMGATTNDISLLAARSAIAMAKDNRDKNLVSWVRNHPTEALKAVRQSAVSAGKDLLVFKVFPKQITAENLLAILATKDLATAIVKRRPVDSYISYVKAKLIGKWLAVDTSDVKVELRASDYIVWHASASGWYRSVETFLGDQNLNHFEFNYESSICLEPNESLSLFIDRCNSFNFEIKMPDSAQVSGYRRQDLSERSSEKVSNWESFYRDICRQGSEAMLSEFF